MLILRATSSLSIVILVLTTAIAVTTAQKKSSSQTASTTATTQKTATQVKAPTKSATASKTTTQSSPTANTAKTATSGTASTPTGTTSKATGPVNASANLTGLLSIREKELLDEINLVRSNPAAYVKVLESFKKNYKGKELHYPNRSVLITNEGIEAVDDAIKFLRTAQPAPPLELRRGLISAAKVQLKDLAADDSIGHRGRDRSTPTDRIGRYGIWQDSVGENIVYDSHNPSFDVAGMIIDDGTSNRGHRRNLLKSNFRVVGLAWGSRSNGSALGVITFAGGLVDK